MILLYLRGGIVQHVEHKKAEDDNLESTVVLDFDHDGIPEEELCEVVWVDGEKEFADVYEVSTAPKIGLKDCIPAENREKDDIFAAHFPEFQKDDSVKPS